MHFNCDGKFAFLYISASAQPALRFTDNISKQWSPSNQFSSYTVWSINWQEKALKNAHNIQKVNYCKLFEETLHYGQYN